MATCLAGGMLACILIGGIVADRVSQRAIIVTVEAVNLAAVGAVAALGALGTLRLWHVAATIGRWAARRWR